MKQWYLLMMLWLTSVELFAQNNSAPVLERDITLNLNNQPLVSILTTISQQADFVFSYNPEVINPNELYSINISQQSVRQALNQIFNGSVEYKVRGKYLILKKNSLNPVTVNSQNCSHMVEGYISDSKSGHKLANVSVYDKNLLVSAITDRYGYFRIELQPVQIKSGLHISKYGYADTLVTNFSGKTSYINVELSSAMDVTKETAGKNPARPSDAESDNSKLPHWLIPDKIRINMLNIKDTVFRNVQFSLLPLLSTNKLLTGSAINSVSINLTAGYVQGVRIAEVGGVLNMVRNDAKVCQLAGVGNIVGRSFLGFQAAGVFNISKTMRGVQSSGVLNIVRENSKGVQIAGVLNYSREVTGVQISGLINMTTYIKGVQLSVFNFADSCHGIPVGIFSYVKNGYHKIELSADELFYTNIAFRSGVNRFHTIIMAGIRPDNFKIPLWSYGYGIGTTLGKQAKMLYDIDFSLQQINKGSYSDLSSSLYKLYLGIDRKIASKTSLAAGITYNFYVTDTKSSDYQGKYSLIAPYYFSNTTYNNGLNLKTWLGGKIGFRFL